MASVPQQTSRTGTGSVIGRAVFAVLFAVGFWVWVASNDDPDRKLEFPNIAVNPVNVPPGLAITDLTPQVVRLAVWGPNSVVNGGSVQARNFVLSVDLREARAGTASYPVRITDTVRDLRKRETDPAMMQVTLERRSERTLTVTVPTPAQTGVQVRSFTANPAQVQVRGPESRVNAVAQVVAAVELRDRTVSFQDSVEVRALDANGTAVPGVTFDTPRVLVAVDIPDLGNKRTVPVNANIAGSPASGFVNTDVVIDPPQVTLVGDLQRIRVVPNVPTEPIDIDGLRQTTARMVPLARLPDGVMIEGNITSVRVQVIVQERTLDENFSVPITFTPPRPGLTYTATASETTVKLRGTRQQLDEIRNQITVRADLSTFAAPTGGPRPVDLVVLLPTDSKVLRVGDPSPAMVQVNVVAVPTPTPIPTPTATAVPPTPTAVPPTATPVPSTPTPIPPTATPRPPTMPPTMPPMMPATPAP